MDFEIIIYTCNRAMQLDLLLRSMEKFIVGYNPQKVWVFYKPPMTGNGYVKLFNKHKDLNLIPQNNFRRDLKALTRQIKSKYVLGLCDDYIFINPLDIDIPYVIGDSSPYPLGRKCVNLWMVPGMDFCFSPDRKMDTPGIDYPDVDCFWWKWTLVKDKKQAEPSQ